MKTSAIDFGHTSVTVRGPRGWPSGRIGVRYVIVVGLLILAALAVAVIALASGDYHVAPLRVLDTVFGGGTSQEQLVVNQWRLPRVAAALVLGGALGASGAIFQSLTRNPLGSPDIIGFNTGAYTGALVVLLVLGGTQQLTTAAGALIGGVLTALVVYLFAFRRGVTGFRLIIVGIGISAMLASINTWLILKADLDESMSAATWGGGTLNALDWAQVTPALVAIAVLVPLVALIGYLLPMVEMGDDAASALGIPVERVRLAAVIVGVALTAVATAVAGPIAFVALAAPQVARRLTGSSGVPIAGAAAMGSLLLVASDAVAQHGFGTTVLPVGVVTASIGGVYLVWLLAREALRA